MQKLETSRKCLSQSNPHMRNILIERVELGLAPAYVTRKVFIVGKSNLRWLVTYRSLGAVEAMRKSGMLLIKGSVTYTNSSQLTVVPGCRHKIET